MPVEHLTSATYRGFALRPDVAVVHFWAAWDTTHLWMRWQIEKAIASIGGAVRHAMVDTDLTDDLCRRLGIANVPTLIYYRDGAAATTRIGNLQSTVIADDLIRIRMRPTL